MPTNVWMIPNAAKVNLTWNIRILAIGLHVSGCQNLVGGYKCGCPEGYTLHYYYNHCVDTNECLTNPCGNNGDCINTPGSYRCGCPDGYQFDHSSNICLQVIVHTYTILIITKRTYFG